MTRNVFVTAFASLLIGACCLRRIDIDRFIDAALSRQIAEYESARERGCVTSEHLALLSAMSTHKDEAINAMAELLDHPRPDFPERDVLIVIEFAQNRGGDVKGHSVLRRIQRIAATASDPDVREEARRILDWKAR